MSGTGYKKNKKRKKGVAPYYLTDYNAMLIDETTLRALEESIMYAPRRPPGSYTYAIHPDVYTDLKEYQWNQEQEDYGEWYELTQI